MDDEVSSTCIIDNGSHSIKAGVAGEAGPKSVFPSIVGRLRNVGLWVGPPEMGQPQVVWCGHECMNRKGILSTRYPIEHGIVCNWDDMVC